MDISINVAKERARVLVIALVGEKDAMKWWDSRNRAFDMKTPLQQWEEDYLKVYHYLMDYGYGR